MTDAARQRVPSNCENHAAPKPHTSILARPPENHTWERPKVASPKLVAVMALRIPVLHLERKPELQ